ncbi:hypothetical protein HK104_010197 [Borealophlyctis nickersoniae]|nr:hypothetical protein HK104_010197 [Borealophlyctis nickersoniae]
MTSAHPLLRFSTCDLSDGLTRLNLTGHIPNLNLFSPNPTDPSSSSLRICGPAHTVEFEFASNPLPPTPQQPIPHHIDSAPPHSIFFIKSPPDAPNAVWGGLKTARAKALDCQGTVIYNGRVRDVAEAQSFNYPVFASGRSTMGANPQLRIKSVGEAVVVSEGKPWEVTVREGDVIVADAEGVVCVPKERVDELVGVCEQLVEIDGRCMEDLKNGRPIGETFKEHRGKGKGTEIKAKH